MMRKTRCFLLKAALAVILLLGAYICLAYTEKELSKPDAAENTPGSDIAVRVSDIDDTGFLELVNAQEPITDGSGGVIVAAWPTVPVGSRDVTLNKTALAAAARMFSAADSEHAGSFYISSGYRGYAEQERTYEEMADKSYVQPAGHSEHETGLAADIMAKGVSQSDMGVSAEGQWLAENAWKYGFILRYPMDKTQATGISYEPWHFRYVGQPHAWYCAKNGLCYEEYISFLKSRGGYTATLDGKTYSVLYETPENGIIYVPEGRNYSVSDDNTGGYIITAWK